MKCKICPRECGADRDNGQIGACGVDSKIYIARSALHMWEEPCISGAEGSGTVFFVGCPLGCIYCQNVKISKCKKSQVQKNEEFHYNPVSTSDLADKFIELQNQGANNINLVTPTHYSYEIKEAVCIAKDRGLNLPIVYNCSGYEKIETLKALEGIIDIYLTDFKYMDTELAKRYSYAGNYPEVAMVALDEMVRQCKQPVFDDRGIMRRGVIVRNLLLPGCVKNSKEVVKYVYETYGDNVYISVMNQYTPLEQVIGMSPLDRKTTKREYKRLIDYILELGANNVFIQEGEVASESFIPDFE